MSTTENRPLDLSAEELALCVAALRERAAIRDKAGREPGSVSPATRGQWMHEAFQAASLAAKIEDALAHQTAE